jgi:thioredoxin 1
MASKNIVVLSDNSFDKEVLQSDKPALVDFYADWCAPCRMMAPVVDELADEYAEKIKVCKLDTDAHREAPTRYGISGIPTLILFKGGKAEKRFIGVSSKSDIKKVLDSAAG